MALMNGYAIQTLARPLLLCVSFPFPPFPGDEGLLNSRVRRRTCLPSPRPLIRRATTWVDYEEKVFEDVKAEPGEKALVTFHTVAFEGSIGLVNLLQAVRLQRKGFATSVLLYGPGVTLGVQRGFPETRRRSLSGPPRTSTIN